MSADASTARTGIQFVAGFEPGFAVPDVVASAPFAHRFAVIQETYRPDSADMFFDEALWMRLVEFARTFGPDVRIENDEADRFLSTWRAQTADERAPSAIQTRVNGHPVLHIEPEFWTAIGGPTPYHDSYTYAVYTKEDVGERVIAFLRNADTTNGWDIADTVQSAKEPTVLGAIKRFFRDLL